MAERDDDFPTLKGLLESRQLASAEVLDWSWQVAADLSALHACGSSHGDVAAANVRLEDGTARLSPRYGLEDPAGTLSDVLRFSILLRSLIDRAPWSADNEPLKTALEKVAGTCSRAAAGTDMRKVAAALHVLRSARNVESLMRRRVTPPMSSRKTAKPARRVLLLVREIATPERRKVRPTMMQMLAFLGAAEAIVLLAAGLFSKLPH